MPVRYKGGGSGGITTAVEWGPNFGGPEGDQFGAEGQVQITDLSLVASLSCGSQVTLPAVNVTGNLSTAGQVQLTALAVEHTKLCGCDIVQLQYQISSFLAAKDSWVDSVIGCVANSNHDNTDLQFDGTPATSKIIYIGFDLSKFDSNSEVTAGTLHLRLKTAPLLTDQTLEIFKIADAGEAWAESTITCSNRPATDGAAMQSFLTGLVNNTELNVPLNATSLARVDARMGQTSCTFVLQNSTLSLLTGDFEATDEGTNDALGPRLELTFNGPLANLDHLLLENGDTLVTENGLSISRE